MGKTGEREREREIDLHSSMKNIKRKKKRKRLQIWELHFPCMEKMVNDQREK